MRSSLASSGGVGRRLFLAVASPLQITPSSMPPRAAHRRSQRQNPAGKTLLEFVQRSLRGASEPRTWLSNHSTASSMVAHNKRGVPARSM